MINELNFFVHHALQRRLQRENRPTTTTDQVKSTIGNQFSASRRGAGPDPAASVDPLFSDSSAKIALCSLASTRATNERRHSFAEPVEESSTQSRKRAHSSLSYNSSDVFDQQKINAASAAFAAARRPRRRPIDPFRELIVLIPEDVNDQIRKMGLTPAEIPEFLLCLDEQVDYDEEENEEEDAASNLHEEKGVITGAVVQNIKLEVYTPTVKINKYYEAKQKAGCGFSIRSLPAQIKCSHYDEYEADSEDEKFLANLDTEYIAQSETIDNSIVKKSKINNIALAVAEVEAEVEIEVEARTEECSIVSTDDVLVDDSIAAKDKDKHGHLQNSDLKNGNYSNESEKYQINGNGNENASRNIRNTTTTNTVNGGKKEDIKQQHRFLREDTFQKMIAVLERELEVAIGTKNLLKDTQAIYTKCGNLLDHSRTASELVETFLSEDSEEEHSLDGNGSSNSMQKNVLSLQSLEELLSLSKKEQKYEEEELLRLALASGSNSLKMDSKEGSGVVSKEGDVVSLKATVATSALKRGRPVGRVSDRASPHTQSHPHTHREIGAGHSSNSNGDGSSTSNGTGNVGVGGGGSGNVAVTISARRGRPPLSKSRVKDKDREKEKEKEKEKKQSEDEAQDTTVAGRSPFQAFVDVLKDEVRKNREWQDSVKQLQGEASKVQDSEAMRKAKEVYERARVSPISSLSLSLSRCSSAALGRARPRGHSAAPRRRKWASSGPASSFEGLSATSDLGPDGSRARELPEMTEGRSRSAFRRGGCSNEQLLDEGTST